MKSYLNWQRPLYKTATGTVKHFDLPLHAVVKTGVAVGSRVEVTYNGVSGWVDADYLDEYHETLPRDCVDLDGIQTPNPNDAEQYIIINGEKIVNACGMLCIAFVLNKPALNVFQTWERSNPKHYDYIDGRNWLTSADDLKTILDGYNVVSHPLRLSRLTNGKLYQIPGKVIIGVSINKYSGKLQASGIRHWVVVTEIFRERYGGTVDVYNPFPNRIERYSWDEFTASVGRVGGLAVK